MADLDFSIQNIAKEIAVDADGKGKSSIRGTALLAGVKHPALIHHFRSGKKKPSKLAELLTQQGFTPGSFSKDGIPDIAVAIIVKYYAWMAGARCTDQAKEFDMILSGIGTRAWMQQITGWTPQRAAAVKVFGDVIARNPLPWEAHFSKEWQRNAERITGYKWEWRVMGKFIKQHVYDLMPIDVRQALDEVNPMNDAGRRKSCQHQHFTEQAAPILKSHVGTVLDLMRASVSLKQFEDLMDARFSGIYQLRFETVLQLPEAG